MSANWQVELSVLRFSLGRAWVQTAARPPSTGIKAPWTNLAASVVRNRIALAISCGEATRPAGEAAAIWSSASPMDSVPSVRVEPGDTALTRIPLGPNSAAQALVSRPTAALLEP